MKNKDWTPEQISGIAGKVIVVSGGNSGLGYESVKVFAAKGAEVILASRSLEKGKEAKAKILNDFPEAKIEVMALDLGDLESIRAFAETFRRQYKKLDILLNNAGIMMSPYFQTKDGFEAQNGINHLGHFALTGLLMDLIIKTPNARVVNVSSIAHRNGTMDFTNLLYEGGKGYSPIKAYGRSKLSNLLFTYELQRKLEAAQINSIAVAAHPGISTTNLVRYMEGKFLFKILIPLFNSIAQDPAAGALPQIRASIDPGVKGGEYYGPGGKKERKGFPVLVQSNAASHNLDDAAKLWEESERLTGVKFKF